MATKNNKGLIAAVIVIIILAAVAVWYFFFRTPAPLKVDTGGTDICPTGYSGTPPDCKKDTPLDQYVCPKGTSGTYPVCTLDVVNPDNIFFNAIETAKQRVTNNSILTPLQKSNAITTIDVYVTKDKDSILADASTGKDLVTLILLDAQKIYLANFKVPIVLTIGSLVKGGG